MVSCCGDEVAHAHGDDVARVRVGVLQRYRVSTSFHDASPKLSFKYSR